MTMTLRQWEDKNLNEYLDGEGPIENFDFAITLPDSKHGMARIFIESEEWTDQDYDGTTSGINFKIIRAEWCFDEDGNEIDHEDFSEVQLKAIHKKADKIGRDF